MRTRALGLPVPARWRRWPTALAFVFLLAACAGGPTAPEERPEPAPPLPAAQDGGFGSIPAVYQRVQPSVVAVYSGPDEGSGVIWAADGVIVTNNHVVQGVPAVEVALATGERLPARVRATDPLTDLAVIEVDRGDLPAAEFARRLPQVGELAIALGAPLGLENTVTAGIISGVGREIPDDLAQGQPALVDLIQTDAAISPGNSGGALVNARGEVVGINIAYLPPALGSVSIGFAVPSVTVIDVVDQLLATGEVRHPYLGIQLGSLTEQSARLFGLRSEAGVAVLSVVPGGPAAAAGLRPGDIITAMDGGRVESLGDLQGALRRKRPGDSVTLRVFRDGGENDVAVTLGERPPLR